MKKIKKNSVLALVALAIPGVGSAVQVSDALDLGGAVRARIDYAPDRDIEKMSFDTLFLTARYDSDGIIGAAKYRFYGGDYPYTYTRSLGDISFAEYAWIGYKFDQNQRVEVGLNQVPFGLQRYFGSTFAETLGYVLGLEDLSLVGVKYGRQFDDINLQAGYYVRPMWQGKGTSAGGVTYSNVVARADPYVDNGSNNAERNVLVARVATKTSIANWASEYGFSGYVSTLKNEDTNRKGSRNVVAAHYAGKNGPWGLQFLAARQVMSPRNPDSNNQTVTFGGYDGTFNVATRGNLYVADLSYELGGTYLNEQVSGIRFYANYSQYDKSKRDFRDSQRLILGGAFFVGRHVLIATEWMHGKNDPYVGGSSYTQSLGAGGTDQWKNQLAINIGYYF